jgi:hypothetical protein
MAPELDDVADHLLKAEDPVVAAREVGEALECSRRHALDLLRLLNREGTVASKEIGASAVAWWHEERVTPPQVPPEDHPEQSSLSGAADSPARERPVETAENPPEINAALRVAEIPGEGDRLHQRRDALAVAVGFIRDQSEASAGEIREHVYAEEPAGYASARSMWKNFLQPALGDLDQEEIAVSLLDPHSGTWRAR